MNQSKTAAHEDWAVGCDVASVTWHCYCCIVPVMPEHLGSQRGSWDTWHYKVLPDVVAHSQRVPHREWIRQRVKRAGYNDKTYVSKQARQGRDRRKTVSEGRSDQQV